MVLRRVGASLLAAFAVVAVVAAPRNASAQQPPAGGASGTTTGGAGASGSAGASGTAGTSGSAAASGSAGASGGASGDALVPQDALTPQPGAPGVSPAQDQQKLVQQGRERPGYDGLVGERPQEIFSEDWWAHTRPTIELHGYFRTRGELFHNFALGRHSTSNDPNLLFPQALDNSFTDINGTQHNVQLCGTPNAAGQLTNCNDKSESTANLRLRLEPEIHISDNLRILTQVDLLDNLVLGSTPDSYAMKPGANGYQSAGYNGYAPLGAFATTQGPPTAGINSLQNSVEVQRAWAEYLTPVGQLRFGRMPHQWGLGMMWNSGNGIDQDWQSNIDRIMFSSGLKSIDLYFGGAWDFPSTGTTTASPFDVYGGQPYNTSNIANVEEWGAFVVRRTNPEMQRLKLSRNDVVLNGGLYTLYRKQPIDIAETQASQTPLTVDPNAINNGQERRGAEMVIPDVWIQFLWNKLRLEAEGGGIWGTIESSQVQSNLTKDPVKIRQFGFATQAEFRAVEDKLGVQFGSGWASGDPNIEGLAPSTLNVNGGSSGLCPVNTASLQPCRSGPISTFRFNPAYNVDFIFFRKILTRVEGAYYFRPSVGYDFIRNPNGQKFGGSAAIIWSRASEFTQTPGNKRDLGVELDLEIHYQSKDGSLNDDPNKMGGFYTALQYGVFFPLGGLDYLPGVQGTLPGQTASLPDYSLATAQTVRLILGVMF